MNVSLSVLWWLDLNNQVDIRNIKTTCSYICCNENLEFAFFESFDSNLTLTLDDISMHDFHVLLDLVCGDQLICVLLGLSKYDSFSISTIANQSIS